MRIHVSHRTRYRYTASPSAVTQVLRLTPRNHEGQYVIRWRLDLSENCRLHQHEDAFGNITHTFTADGPFDELTVEVEGEIDTQDTHGIVRGAVEPFPPALYLRRTDLTEADDAIAAFADELKASSDDTLSFLHALLREINHGITFDADPTHTTTTAAEVFATKRGVCQDMTHVFIAASRHAGVPARYIGGHFRRGDGVIEQEAGHAWAEAYVNSLGWVAFDPTNGISGTDAHVRVAVGLDYLGASPVRGTRFGGRGEELDVSVIVEQARHQVQS